VTRERDASGTAPVAARFRTLPVWEPQAERAVPDPGTGRRPPLRAVMFAASPPLTRIALAPWRLRERYMASPADAFVVQYDETGADGPVARILGVFSSETSARDALRNLDLTRSHVFHASITSWTVDNPEPRTRVEIDLPD
jgi:hypothetical protein